MKKIIFLIAFVISACATQVNFNSIAGGSKFFQSGMSFNVPSGMNWGIIRQHTYESNLAAYGRDKNETYIIATTIFQIQPNQSKNDFLNLIKKLRDKETITGRFENIFSSVELNNSRNEVCVNFKHASKDLGAQRDGEYTIYETYGMYCIHPLNSEVGMFIELSRKAPYSQSESIFDKLGDELLRSVVFTDFKV